MKFSIAVLTISLASSALLTLRLGAQPPSPPALHFFGMPLGNVARILSAKFRTTITIAANARAPITGDFSALDLRESLEEAARQAHLSVQTVGPSSSAGFCLTPAKPAEATPKTAAVKAALAEAAQRRAQLLRRRADLLDQGSAQE